MSTPSLPELTLADFKVEAQRFVSKLTDTPIPTLFGVTDGKKVGTFVEQAFWLYLNAHYSFKEGNTATGIDFPALEVDLKVTSIRQPQSSCPFRNAEQKVYGLGYNLIVFVYDKADDPASSSAQLSFKHAVFVSREHTADYQTTVGLLEILRRNGNEDDIIGFLQDRNLPIDEIGCKLLAERILREPPAIGYLTVSNALQWRLQYSRIISLSAEGNTLGVENLLG